MRRKDAEERELARRIRLWRESAGLTKTGLADVVGVTNGAVCQWEDSKYPSLPSRKTLGAVARACGVELWVFLRDLPAQSSARD